MTLEADGPAGSRATRRPWTPRLYQITMALWAGVVGSEWAAWYVAWNEDAGKTCIAFSLVLSTCAAIASAFMAARRSSRPFARFSGAPGVRGCAASVAGGSLGCAFFIFVLLTIAFGLSMAHSWSERAICAHVSRQLQPIRDAVIDFHSSTGRSPSSLDELVLSGHLAEAPSLPRRFGAPTVLQLSHSRLRDVRAVEWYELHEQGSPSSQGAEFVYGPGEYPGPTPFHLTMYDSPKLIVGVDAEGDQRWAYGSGVPAGRHDTVGLQLEGEFVSIGELLRRPRPGGRLEDVPTPESARHAAFGAPDGVAPFSRPAVVVCSEIGWSQENATLTSYCDDMPPGYWEPIRGDWGISR